MAHHAKFSVSVGVRDSAGRMNVSKALGDLTHAQTPVVRRSVMVDTDAAVYVDASNALNAYGFLFIMNNGTEDVIFYRFNEVGGDYGMRIPPGLAFWGRMHVSAEYLKSSSGQQPVEILVFNDPV